MNMDFRKLHGYFYANECVEDCLDSAAQVQSFYKSCEWLCHNLNDDEIQSKIREASISFKYGSSLFFKLMNVLLFKSTHGPRITSFIEIIGCENFISMLQKKINNPFGI